MGISNGPFVEQLSLSLKLYVSVVKGLSCFVKFQSWRTSSRLQLCKRDRETYFLKTPFFQLGHVLTLLKCEIQSLFYQHFFFFPGGKGDGDVGKEAKEESVWKPVHTHIHIHIHSFSHTHSYTQIHSIILGQKKIGNITWLWSFFFSQRGNRAPS